MCFKWQWITAVLIWSTLCVDLPDETSGKFVSVIEENWLVCFFARQRWSWAACQRQSHIWWLRKGVALRFFLVNASPEARRLRRLLTPDRALVHAERLSPPQSRKYFFQRIRRQNWHSDFFYFFKKRNCCSLGTCGMGLLISAGSERHWVPRKMELVFQILLRISSDLNKAFLALSLLVWRLGSPGRIYALLH